jgi:hypothetical protein
MIAYYRKKLHEAICNRIETQNQLKALQLLVYPPNSIEIFPSGPNHYIVRQTILSKEEKLDFLQKTGSSMCAYSKVHRVQRKETREYSRLPYLIAIQLDMPHKNSVRSVFK